jgi:hypothetical protein
MKSKRRSFKRSKRRIEMFILTYANKENMFSDRYLRSLFSIGGWKRDDVQLIGIGDKWINFMTKIKACYNFLKDREDEEELCAVTDCYDFLACASKDELLMKYHTFPNAPLVFGAETYCASSNCQPLTEWWKRDPTIETPSKFINAGFYMGKIKDILHAYEFILDQYEKGGEADDQKALGMYVNAYPERVHLDIESKLVGNITLYSFFLSFPKWLCKDGRVYNEPMDEYPCFIHVTGMNLVLISLIQTVLNGYLLIISVVSIIVETFSRFFCPFFLVFTFFQKECQLFSSFFSLFLSTCTLRIRDKRKRCFFLLFLALFII